MKYRKKPVEVEAFQFGVDSHPQWFTDATKDGTVLLFEDGPYGEQFARIQTPEGKMEAREEQHWIIRGVEGEIYPCKNTVFEATYEPVEDK